MFGLFKTKKQKQEDISAIVAQIHEDFLTEVDNLLAEASIKVSTESNKKALLSKADVLRTLGFTSTKEVTIAEKEIDRLSKARGINTAKDKLIKAINYFSFKYPQYKFITEESVQKICQKYGLVYGPVKNYIGTVPTKNMNDIQNFQVVEDDCLYIDTYYSTINNVSYKEYAEKVNSYNETVRRINFDNQRHLYYDHLRYLQRELSRYSKAPLEIAGPQKDFNMEGLRKEGYKLVSIVKNIPDPVVLQPVLFEGTKYYLIVTAWGPEAEDELVVNEKMN